MKNLYIIVASIATVVLLSSCRNNKEIDTRLVTKLYNEKAADLCKNKVYVEIDTGYYELNDIEKRTTLQKLAHAGVIEYTTVRYAWYTKCVDRQNTTTKVIDYYCEDTDELVGSENIMGIDTVANYSYEEHYMVWVRIARKYRSMILDKEPCRPFCKTRAGLNLGEGAAFLVLQLSDVSEEKHDNVWKNAIKPAFYVAGYGNRCDAHHQTATSENGEGAYLAMTDALRMAGISAADIDYVNAHGTGTPDNDRSESAALSRVFADVLPPVSSTKGLTGHTTSASGAIETVICLLAMQEGIIPQNAGWKEQDEECVKPFTGENGSVCNDTIATNNKRKNSDDTGKHTVVLRNVMCNSFGFGGNDSSLVITTEPKASAEAVNHIATKVVADIVIDDIGQLIEAKDYISPKEARRMGRLLKAATLSSMKALRAAGVEKPDAIITATAYGMLENSEKFLADMTENGEQTLSPTLFIQSTHNTIGSQIAIRLGCHGYNITYTQGSKSLDWALLDARRLISTGKAKTVLVGCHDEATPLFQSVFERLGMVPPATIYSRAIVLKADDC